MRSTLHLPHQPSTQPHSSGLSATMLRRHTRQTSLPIRRRSSNLGERRLSTGLSAHDPPVTEDDTLLTTDISTKLQWRQLDDYFLEGSAERAEDVEHSWIHNFGVPILTAYKVKLRSVVEVLERERGLREHAGLTTFPSDTAGDTPDKELDGLFEEENGEHQRRRDSAEMEITLLRELHEASWQWIEAHLDCYAAGWEERLHEKGKGEISIWGELCALRRERDAVEEEVKRLSDTRMNATVFR
jgi:hypothetical protein